VEERENSRSHFHTEHSSPYPSDFAPGIPTSTVYMNPSNQESKVSFKDFRESLEVFHRSSFSMHRMTNHN